MKNEIIKILNNYNIFGSKSFDIANDIEIRIHQKLNSEEYDDSNENWDNEIMNG